MSFEYQSWVSDFESDINTFSSRSQIFKVTDCEEESSHENLRRNTDLLGQDRVDRDGRPFVFLNSFVTLSKSLITENKILGSKKFESVAEKIGF